MWVDVQQSVWLQKEKSESLAAWNSAAPAMQALQLETDIPPLLDQQWFGRRFCWDETSSPVILWFDEDQRSFGLALKEPGVQMLRL